MKQIVTKKKGHVFLFLFFLSFFSLNLVVAQQPPAVQTNINIESGLQIEFAQVQFFAVYIQQPDILKPFCKY